MPRVKSPKFGDILPKSPIFSRSPLSRSEISYPEIGLSQSNKVNNLYYDGSPQLPLVFSRRSKKSQIPKFTFIASSKRSSSNGILRSSHQLLARRKCNRNQGLIHHHSPETRTPPEGPVKDSDDDESSVKDALLQEPSQELQALSSTQNNNFGHLSHNSNSKPVQQYRASLDWQRTTRARF